VWAGEVGLGFQGARFASAGNVVMNHVIQHA
jgi:hypothetical protein